MSYAVFTGEYRFEWVKGWLTGGTDPMDGSVEVGDDTDYPLKVTLDELAEIFYRVKDGAISGSSTYGPFSMEITGTPPADYYTGTNADIICQRSFAIGGVNQTDERTAWGTSGALDTPIRDASTILPYTPLHGEVAGFTHYVETFDVSYLGYGPYGTPGDTQAGIELAFNGYVAVTGDGNPLDPANDIWVGLFFQAYTVDGLFIYDAGGFTKTDGGFDTYVGDLTFQLSASAPTCKLYFRSTATADFTITATEWWPYNRLAEPRQIWDAGTGEFIPIDAPVLAFDRDVSDLYLLTF